MFFNDIFGNRTPDPHKLYQTLGLQSNCTMDEIKKAYRKLAVKYHPDKLANNASASDKTKFVEINKAYEILSDENSRAQYDNHGIIDGEQQNSMPNDISQIFEFIHRHHNGPGIFQIIKKPELIIIDVFITIEELYTGCKKTVLFDRDVLIDNATNITVKNDDIKYIIYLCETCNGTGVSRNISRNRFIVMEQNRPCTNCNTKGYINMHKNKYSIVKKTCRFEYTISRGTKNNTEIVFPNVGDINLIDQKNNGDICIKICYAPHNFWKLDNNYNLVYRQQISIFEAITSCKFTFIYPENGRNIIISIGDAIYYDTQKIIKRYGIPQDKEMTDLVILFDIIYPDNLTNEQTNLIQTIFPNYFHKIANDVEKNGIAINFKKRI